MLGNMRGRLWAFTDRTGGPVDDLFDQLRQHVPDLIVERLEVTHPGDDDNVYFLGNAAGFDLVQLDTGPEGRPPFLIEATQRIETHDLAEAVGTIRAWLSSTATTNGT